MANSYCGLSELTDGQTGRILSLDGGGELRQRLLDLGFVEGARVTRLYSAPSGDPAAYGIGEAVIALRACDAAGIAVKCAPSTGKR